MGMSHDFEVAIEEGSTCVRLGTAIFGDAHHAMIPIRDTPSGATFQVKVHPRAKKNAITGVVGDALKLALTAPPVEGRANEACIAFLAEVLNVPAFVGYDSRRGNQQKQSDSYRRCVSRSSGRSAAGMAGLGPGGARLQACNRKSALRRAASAAEVKVFLRLLRRLKPGHLRPALVHT